MKRKDPEKQQAIGKQLEAFFKEKGMLKKDIALKLGITQAYITKILSGERGFSMKQAKRWSDLFGLSEVYLLTGTGSIVKEDNPSMPIDLTKERLCKLSKDELVDLAFKAIELANKHIDMCNKIISQNSSIISSSEEVTRMAIELCNK